MTPVRYNYSYSLDEETISLLQKQASSNNRLPVCSVKIPASAISQDDTEWLHCVEAKRVKAKLYIRVITNTHRGINIMIPCNTTEMYHKFMDLRFQVRNQDRVLVTFPELFIEYSGRRQELYLRSYDFKVFGSEKQNKQDDETPFPSFLI